MTQSEKNVPRCFIQHPPQLSGWDACRQEIHGIVQECRPGIREEHHRAEQDDHQEDGVRNVPGQRGIFGHQNWIIDRNRTTPLWRRTEYFMYYNTFAYYIILSHYILSTLLTTSRLKNDSSNNHSRFHRDVSLSSSVSASLPSPSSFTSPSTSPGRLPPTPLTMGGDPKPVKEFEPGEWKNQIPGILNEIGNYTNSQVLDNLQKVANVMQGKTRNDYWLTDEGQPDILRRIHERSRPPTSTSAYGTSTSIGSATTSTSSPLDYTVASKAMLEKKSLSAVTGEDAVASGREGL